MRLRSRKVLPWFAIEVRDLDILNGDGHETNGALRQSTLINQLSPNLFTV